MTYTSDRGGGWREKATPWLEAYGFDVLDPRNLEMPSARPIDIVNTDVAAIAQSKYVLAYGGAPSWGTAMELWQAKQLSTPVFTWLGASTLEAQRVKLSAWLIYTSTAICDTLDEAMEHLAIWELR